ncbi:hypothetical protein [Streptomyces thermolilacinus]|uniref:Uncharacterized protein n=1 Tax=Streptomyces thermolilacinus SPC6 TaxID=1306406 RepID=A0A1D3DS57_9ACTN|nr:hypothetical protein [Streptomyces thermolilacinus]OEJ95158.1 hypothetical protein J116_012320 [Streptomyces thermolilacinus SPC6]
MLQRLSRRLIEKVSCQKQRFTGHIKRLVREGLATAARGTVHGIFSSIGGLAVAAVVWWVKNR